MPLRFEWDAAKAAGNLSKHGVSFEEAATVFDRENVIRLISARPATRRERYDYEQTG